MSDLIRREDVHKMLCRLDNEDETIITAIAALSDIPTAYDIDKVLEQLTTLRDSFQKIDRSMWIGLNNAINIVKKAGVANEISN